VSTDQHSPTVPAGGRQGSNGMGVAGFVTGLLSLLGGWLFVPVGVVLGILGIVLGGVARSRGRRDGAPTGLATAGVVLGAIGLVVCVALWITAAAILAGN